MAMEEAGGFHFLLDITHREYRPLVVIDGVGYFVRRPGDLSLLEREMVNRLMGSWQELLYEQQHLEGFDDQDVIEVTVYEICKRIVQDAEPGSLTRLDYEQRVHLVETFIDGIREEVERSRMYDDGSNRPIRIDWGRIIPIMQGVYHAGSPDSWYHIPQDVLRSYQEMMQIVETRLTMLMAEAAAFGHADTKGRRKMSGRWSRIIGNQERLEGFTYNAKGQAVLVGARQTIKWLSAYGVRAG